MTRLLLGAVFAVALAVASGASADTSGVVTVFESGGISEETMAEIEAIADPTGVLPIHRGTMRMMSVSREGRDVQAFEPGFGVPMSVAAIDTSAATDLADARVLASLGDGSVVMSERSAALRGARAGDTLVLEGWNGEQVPLRITDVLPDASLDWQELVVDLDTAARLGFARIGLVRFAGTVDDAAELQTALDGVPARVTGPGETVDDTDFVLPTVMVKERFGEFSFRRLSGDSIEIDDAWVDANIVMVDIDPLGPFPCHRRVVPYIRSVIADLEQSGLIGLIDPTDFQLAGGCWNPRLIRGGDKGFALSRHAWGIAIDINPSTNRYQGDVSLPEAFGETFREWGFAWGAGWLSPDGMHFEWTELAFPDRSGCSALQLEPSPIPGIDWLVVERAGPCR